MHAVAVDQRDGAVYFSSLVLTDSGTEGRLFKATLSGNRYTIRPFCPAVKSKVAGIAVGTDGNIYLAAIDYGKIVKLDSAGNVLPSVAENVAKPMGVAVDAKNTVYFTSLSGSSDTNLCKATPQGAGYIVEAIKNTGLEWPTAVAADDSKNIYVADAFNRTVRKFSSDGRQQMFSCHYGGEVNTALAVDGIKLYISNAAEGVLKVNATTGECFGSQLFSLTTDPRCFVWDGVSKNYYIGFDKKIIKCDQSGRNEQLIWEGNEVCGVGLDGKQNPVFIGQNKEGALISWIFWRQAGKDEVKMRLFGYLGRLSVRGNDVCFVQGMKVHSTKLHPETNSIDPTYIPIAIGNEPARVALFKEGALYVDGKDVYYATSLANTKKVIGGLDNPKAIAVDQDANIYVANEGSEPRIGKY